MAMAPGKEDAVAAGREAPIGTEGRRQAGKERKEAKNLHDRVEYFGRESGPARELVSLWYQHMYALVLQFVLDARGAFSEYRIQTGKLEFQDLLFLSAARAFCSGVSGFL